MPFNLLFSISVSENESQLVRAVKSFGVMIASKLSFINLKTVIKIAVVATCMYLVAIKANTGNEKVMKKNAQSPSLPSHFEG